MPVIRISDELFSRLQAHARPLVDSPGSVLGRVLDEYERVHGRLREARRSQGRRRPSDGDVAQGATQIYTSTRPIAFVLRGARRPVTQFKEILLTLCHLLHEAHGSDFRRVLDLRGRRRPYFALTGRGMTHPRLLNGTGVYVETNFSAEGVVQLCRQLVELFGYAPTEFTVEVEPR